MDPQIERTRLIVNLAQNNKIAHGRSNATGSPLTGKLRKSATADNLIFLKDNGDASSSVEDIQSLGSPLTSDIIPKETKSVSVNNSKLLEDDGDALSPRFKDFQSLGSPLTHVPKKTTSVPVNPLKLLTEDDGDVSSPSFEDFQSSGSEFIPPTEDFSSDSAEIPYQNPCVEESSYSKVKRYLKGLSVCSDNDDDNDAALIPECRSFFEIPDLAIIPSCSKTTNKEKKEKNTDKDKMESQLHNVREIEEPYKKTKSASERPTICPICFKDVITHFSRHLIRHHKNHKDVVLLQSYKPKSKERLDLISALRKQGYFHLKVEKGILNPVRNSKNPNVDYYVCTYCPGHYSKKLLYKHVKTCKSKPTNTDTPGNKCLTNSQTFLASVTSRNHDFLKTSRIKSEVFGIMRPDDISLTAKNDALICLYGEHLLNKHKRQQMATVVSNKIREMARLLRALKSINNDVQCLFDALKPEMFRFLIIATKEISGFNPETKCFKAPSLALHMGTNLKIACDVALKLVIEKRNIPNIIWTNREEKKKDIKELRKLIEGHWCNELASLALKALKEKQWAKPIQLPLTSDIQKFQLHLNNRADEAYNKLKDSVSDIKMNYTTLTECVLTLTVMFNRKRIGDVQYLKIETYENSSNENCGQEAFLDSLSTVEKIISKKFKRIVTGGKGSKPVPILFSNRIQKFIHCLLEVRRKSNVVPQSNPYLFANPGSANRWMSGTNVIRKLALNCGATNPLLLTSTRFRKHIATTLQLMSMEDCEMEQVASFMGHTKKTHAEFYRLPQDIYQTAKVAKILLLMEKGKGKEFKGKSLNEIELERDVYYSSESEDENENPEADVPPSEQALERALSLVTHTATNEENLEIEGNEEPREEHPYNDAIDEDEREKNRKKGKRHLKNDSGAKITNNNKSESKKICLEKKQKEPTTSGRLRWSGTEKQLVLRHFAKHIKKKITPKKHECEELIALNMDVLGGKDWVRVKTFVYNSFRLK